VIVLTASPGRVAESVEVPLAYPRHQVQTRSDPQYLALRERLYRSMFAQATAARAEAG
jgi:NitT/TauT family transport system ATP-binding protein